MHDTDELLAEILATLQAGQVRTDSYVPSRGDQNVVWGGRAQLNPAMRAPGDVPTLEVFRTPTLREPGIMTVSLGAPWRNDAAGEPVGSQFRGVAVVEWGIGAGRFSTTVDWSRGQTFSIAAQQVTVRAGMESYSQVVPVNFEAGAAIGGALRPAVRTVRLASVSAKGGTATANVPPFAKRVSFRPAGSGVFVGATQPAILRMHIPPGSGFPVAEYIFGRLAVVERGSINAGAQRMYNRPAWSTRALISVLSTDNAHWDADVEQFDAVAFTTVTRERLDNVTSRATMQAAQGLWLANETGVIRITNNAGVANQWAVTWLSDQYPYGPVDIPNAATQMTLTNPSWSSMSNASLIFELEL
jgi:hypothetical protein